MCACPTAEMRCALALAGLASAAARWVRAAAAVPAMSPRSSASSARSSARRISCRRASLSASSRISSSSTSMSRVSPHTSSSRTARSTRPIRYSGASPAVSLSPNGVGRNPPARMSGLAAISTSRSICSPPRAGLATGRYAFCGAMPFTGVPDASYTSASAWLPGQSPTNPRSNTASTRRPAQSCGTVPVTRSQLVDHGRPHGSPTANGRYDARNASATGTGSSGTCHTARSSGTNAAYFAGATRSASTRASRSSTSRRSSCIPKPFSLTQVRQLRDLPLVPVQQPTSHRDRVDKWVDGHRAQGRGP